MATDMTTVPRSLLSPRYAWRVLVNAGQKFLEHDCFTYSAALAFYFLMALFPFLIFLASTFAYLPVPHLFDRVVRIMDRIVPPEGMKVVHYVLTATLHKNKTLLSAGFLGALWAAAAGFHSTASALNKAYAVKETRSFLKRRLLALAFTCLLGGMGVVAMTAIALGPHFGFWLTGKLGLRAGFALVWPFLRWTIIMAFTVLAIELLYLAGPNVRVRFRTQVPGALLAVAAWLFASGGLGWYFRGIANFNKMYGALGAVIALMLWFYVSAISILAGAELNAELIRRGAK